MSSATNAAPLAIDLFAGLGGWTEGLLAEGYRVVGFDNERHVYGEHRYPAQLVLQDVLTIHGRQLKNADLIVASPPCQEFSYMAMPWSRAKAIAADYRAGVRDVKQLTALFDACFRIQREASEAKGEYIPLVVENVRGAIPWVGRSRWNFGSFHLWGDVPALMPKARAQKVNPDGTAHGRGSWFAIADSKNRGQKVPTESICDCGHRESVHGINGFDHNLPCSQCSCINPIWKSRRTALGNGARFTTDCDGIKNRGVKLSEVGFNVSMARKLAPVLTGAAYERTEDDKRQHLGLNRRAASAMIAKIPLVLSRHIASVYKP